MIVTLLLLIILAATVAGLPRSERVAGVIAALFAFMTAAVLTVSEAGLAMTPNGWLFAVTLIMALFNSALAIVEPDVGKQKWELR